MPAVLFCDVPAVVVSPVSKIRVEIEPLAENVSPPVALVALVVVLAEPVVFELAVPVLVELPVPVGPVGGVYCATAGPRLNAAAKSPKTSTSAIAIGAFFIAENVHE